LIYIIRVIIKMIEQLSTLPTFTHLTSCKRIHYTRFVSKYFLHENQLYCTAPCCTHCSLTLFKHDNKRPRIHIITFKQLHSIYHGIFLLQCLLIAHYMARRMYTILS